MEPTSPRPSAARLQELPLFADLTLGECERISAWSEEVEFAPGRVIAREGTHAYSFFVILDGTASVSHGESVVRTLGPGDHFGEKAILESGLRTATVTAADRVTAMAMIGFNFRELERHFPSVASRIDGDAEAWGQADLA